MTWNTEEKLVCPANVAARWMFIRFNHHGLDVAIVRF